MKLKLLEWIVSKFRKKPNNCWISFNDGEHLYVNESGKRWIDIKPTDGATFKMSRDGLHNRWTGTESGMFL